MNDFVSLNGMAMQDLVQTFYQGDHAPMLLDPELVEDHVPTTVARVVEKMKDGVKQFQYAVEEAPDPDDAALDVVDDASSLVAGLSRSLASIAGMCCRCSKLVRTSASTFATPGR